jgi:D-alanyl-D-alanine carboxypeptidase (penicillin-binding protein 5/6)
MERRSGRVLFEQDADKKLPMASTTKIFTCITVIENCPDLEREIEVPACAEGVEGSSLYLRRGEKHKIIDLLYGLMLRSGNDCAVTLAIHTGGSIENFARLCLQTAAKAGCTNTSLKNPHGLHDDRHYTTARDLALITSYAMKNEVFRRIVGSKSHRIDWPGEENGRLIANKNKILSTYDGGCGVKTGYTKKAGRCLVSASEKDGLALVCVVLSCPDMFADSIRLMNDARDEYAYDTIIDSVECATAKVGGGKKSEVALRSEKTFAYPLTDDEKARLEVKISDVKDMIAPVKAGDKNGKIEVFLDKRLIFSSDLITIYNVEKKSIWDRIFGK